MEARAGDFHGVFVIGAHRSGTSALARAINLLGVPLCREHDLMPAGEGNVAGHWEARSLTRRNEQLLHLLHSAWDCPPPASPEVGERLRADVRPGPARAAFARAHDADRWVWKDPRLSILLPFWHGALTGQHSVVLVVRHPLEVSRSLAARNGLAPAHGLAIWERYLRHALISCTGMPVLVVSQADLVGQPARTVEAVRAFLVRGGLTPHRAVGSAVAAVDPELSHHAASPREGRLSEEQRRLWKQVQSCLGEHQAFAPPEVGDETPGLDAYLAPRRSHWGWVAPAGLKTNSALGEPPPYSAEETGAGSSRQLADAPSASSTATAAAGAGSPAI